MLCTVKTSDTKCKRQHYSSTCYTRFCFPSSGRRVACKSLHQAGSQGRFYVESTREYRSRSRGFLTTLSRSLSMSARLPLLSHLPLYIASRPFSLSLLHGIISLGPWSVHSCILVFNSSGHKRLRHSYGRRVLFSVPRHRRTPLLGDQRAGQQFLRACSFN